MNGRQWVRIGALIYDASQASVPKEVASGVLRRMFGEFCAAPAGASFVERLGAVDFMEVGRLAEESFRHDAETLAMFRGGDYTGQRRDLSTAFCPNRGAGAPRFEFVHRLSEGVPPVPMRNTLVSNRSIRTVNSTLNRLAYILYRIRRGDGVGRMVAASEDLTRRLAAAGAGLPELLGMVGSPDIFIERPGCPGTYYVDCVDFLRHGFLSAVVHASGVPVKKTRQAVTSAGRSSLVASVLTGIKTSALKARADADPGLLDAVHCLDVAWERLFAGLERSFSGVCLERPKTSPPKAFDILCVAYVIEHLPEEEKTRDMRQASGLTIACPPPSVCSGLLTENTARAQVLAFIGLSFMCGFRSGQISSMRFTGHRAESSMSDICVTESSVRNKFGGFHTVVARRSKKKVSMIRSIPLPEWAGRWIKEYEQVREARGGHSGLFTTATGLSLMLEEEPGVDLGKSSRMESFIKHVLLPVLRKIGYKTGDAPELPEDRDKPQRVNYTTYFRSVFFNSLSPDSYGGMMDLMGRAERHVLSKGKEPARFECGSMEAVLPLEEMAAPSNQHQIEKWMATVNESSTEQADRNYSENVLDAITALIPRYDAIKTYVWGLLDRQALDRQTPVSLGQDAALRILTPLPL